MPASGSKRWNRRLIPNDATWDDLMYRVYVRQAMDAGRQDAAEGRLVDVAEVRRRFGLPG